MLIYKRMDLGVHMKFLSWIKNSVKMGIVAELTEVNFQIGLTCGHSPMLVSALNLPKLIGRCHQTIG